MAIATAYGGGINHRFPTWPHDGLKMMFWDNHLGSYSGAGNVIKDLSGNENNGTLVGFPTTGTATSGYYEKSLRFDGVNDRINFSNSWLTGKTEFSFYTICKIGTMPNSYNSYTNGILGPDGGGSQLVFTRVMTPYTHYTPYLFLGGNTINFEFYGSNANIAAQRYTDLSKFYHIAFTVKPGEISVYANGVLFHQVVRSIGYLTTPLRKIGVYGGVQYWNGQIPVVMGYDRVLSPTEIKQIYTYFKDSYR